MEKLYALDLGERDVADLRVNLMHQKMWKNADRGRVYDKKSQMFADVFNACSLTRCRIKNVIKPQRTLNKSIKIVKLGNNIEKYRKHWTLIS